MEIVKKSLKQFTENFVGSSFHMTQNVSIYKSGVDYWSMNFCFIEEGLKEKEIDFIKNKLDLQSVVISEKNIKEMLIEDDNFYFIAEIPLMIREEVPDFYKSPHYDDMEILAVSDYPMIFPDFIKVFAEVRDLDEEYLKNLINIENLTKNNHFFVAYMSEIPVGIFYAVSFDDNAFIIDASVKESYRNTGILNAMAKKAKEEALSREIFNFYSIPSSEFSVRVMNDQGYKPLKNYYVWYKT